MTKKMQLNNLDPIKDKEKIQKLLAKSHRQDSPPPNLLPVDLLLVHHLRSLGNLTKLRLLRLVRSDTLRKLLDVGILVKTPDHNGLDVYTVNDELR